MAGSICALSYLLTAPGTPIIYYGQEQGFNQNCNFQNMNTGDATSDISQTCQTINSDNAGDDVLKRQDMFIGSGWRLGSAVPAINDLNYIGVWNPIQTSANWRNDPFLRTDHDLYKNLRKFTHISRSCQALRQGTMVWRNAQPFIGGMLFFSRIFQSKEEIVVIINPGSQTQTLSQVQVDNTVNFNASFQVYKNLFNGFQQGTIGYQSGQAYLFFNNIQIAPSSYMIFVHQNNVAPYDPDLACQLCLN